MVFLCPCLKQLPTLAPDPIIFSLLKDIRSAQGHLPSLFCILNISISIWPSYFSHLKTKTFSWRHPISHQPPLPSLLPTVVKLLKELAAFIICNSPSPILSSTHSFHCASKYVPTEITHDLDSQSSAYIPYDGIGKLITLASLRYLLGFHSRHHALGFPPPWRSYLSVSFVGLSSPWFLRWKSPRVQSLDFYFLSSSIGDCTQAHCFK